VVVFADLDPDSYEVKASKPGYRTASRNVAVAAGEERPVVLNLSSEPATAGAQLETAVLVLGLLFAALLAAVVGVVLARRRRPPPKDGGARVERRTPAAKTERRKDKPAGGAPTLRTGTSKIPGSVKLEWDSFPNDEGYVLFHLADGEVTKGGPPKAPALGRLVELPKGTGSYVHEELDEGSEHWYSLALRYATGGESPRSKPISATASKGE
jgi:hypothetical protein